MVDNINFTFPPPNPRCRVLKLQEIVAHTDTVNSVNLGKKSAAVMCTGGDDRVVNCWRVGKHQPIMTLTGHIAEVDTVTFDATEQHICGGSRSGVIKVWNCSTQQLYRTLSGHRSSITALDFHPFGDFFASGSSDCNVKVWDINQRACMQTYKGHGAIITNVIHSPDGRWLVSGDIEGVIRVWDLATTKVIHEMKTFRKEPVVSLAFHPAEFLLAVASSHSISCWDMETFELISTTSREANPIKKITFDSDGAALISAQTDSLRIWGWEPSQCYDSVDVSWPGLCDLSVSPNKELICVSKNKTVVTVQLLDLPLLAPFNSLGTAGGDQENVPQRTTARNSTGIARKATNGIVGGDTEKETSTHTWSREKTSPIQQHQTQTQTQTAINNVPVIQTQTTSAPNLHSPTPSSAVIPFPSLTPSSIVSPPSSSHLPFEQSATPLTATKSKASILNSPNAAFFKAHAAAATISLDNVFVPTSFQTPLSSSYASINRQPIIQPQPQSQPSLPPSSTGSTVIKAPWPVRNTNVTNNNNNISTPQQPLIMEQKTLSPNPAILPKPITSLSVSSTADIQSANTQHQHQHQQPQQPHPITLNTPIQSLSPQPILPSFISPSILSQSPSKSPPPPQSLQQPFPSLNDSETLRNCLLNEQSYVSSMLTARRSHLSLLRRYWCEGDIKACINNLSDINEQAITFDFLHAIQYHFIQSNTLTLDMSIQLLPLLTPLFSSIVDTHVQTAQEYLLLIIQSFGTLIHDNHQLMLTIRNNPYNNSNQVDLVREERMQKCEICWTALQHVYQMITTQIQKGSVTAKILHEHSATNALQRLLM